MSRTTTLIYLIFSFVGFLDASFLSMKHYLRSPVTCGSWQGCDVVTASSYATLNGIPIATLGALYYLVVFLLIIAYLDEPKPIFIHSIAWITAAGFFASLYLFFVQAFILESYCLYCIGSLICSSVLFITTCLIQFSSYIKRSSLKT